jgi:hypothetical protein
VSSLGFVPRGYKRVKTEDVTEYSSIFGRVLEMAVEGDLEEMGRKELGSAKITSSVI